MFIFFRLLSSIFKWQRFIFILISLEFLVMSLFIDYSWKLNNFYFFYFLSFTVISRVIGMIIMVGILKFYGKDLSLFYRFKLSL
jgi:hypothetical protein